MATFTVNVLHDNTVADAELTLREAIDAADASPGADTIEFSVSGTIVLTQGQLFIDHELTIDGDNTGDDKADITIDANGASRVMELRTESITLDALTLTGGNATGVLTDDQQGGGIFAVLGADVTIQNSTITGNTAQYIGGGIATGFGTTLTITDSTISGNTSVYGGGVYTRSGTTTMTNTTVHGNAAVGGTYSGGGGIVVSTGGSVALTLTHSTVTGNSATSQGGGLYVYGTGTATVTNSIISGNFAPSAPDAFTTNASNLTYSGTNIIGTDVFTGNTDTGDTTLGTVFDTVVSVDPDGAGGVAAFNAGELADNGGPVQTVALKFDASNPALDVQAAMFPDARGEPRFDNPGIGNDGMGFADAGAFELQCFGQGTRIATPAGERAVETLRTGEAVLTTDGRAVPVLWLGRQRVVTAQAGLRQQPVRIRAGALGRGLPHSDLIVTGDHGMIVEGLVINASALVNGGSIDWVPLAEQPEEAVYYHVETAAHDEILANGAPAETFIDYVGRKGFENYQEYLDLYGHERIIPEMPQPRISSRHLVPERIRAKLNGPIREPEALAG